MTEHMPTSVSCKTHSPLSTALPKLSQHPLPLSPAGPSGSVFLAKPQPSMGGTHPEFFPWRECLDTGSEPPAGTHQPFLLLLLSMVVNSTRSPIFSAGLCTASAMTKFTTERRGPRGIIQAASREQLLSSPAHLAKQLAGEAMAQPLVLRSFNPV